MPDRQIEINADLTPILGPTLDQYFGPWFMEESYFMQEVQALQTMDLTVHIEKAKQDAAVAEEQANGKPFRVIRDNIARIDIEGTMTKRGSSLGGGGTIATRRQVRTAMNDPDIAGIFLRIDSPGGTVAGTKDLADDVFAATRRKPVMTFFEDTGASAAYYVGSQATVKRANTSAVIGSIGTVLVVMDLSEMAKDRGIKVHVVSSGPFKGAGAPGSEVTEQHLAYFQERINQASELFMKDVSRGTSLNMSQVRQLADGRIHMADKAVELGLIDGVASMDEALDELVSLTSSNRRAISMSTEKPVAETAQKLEPVAATLPELKLAFPNASPEFLVSQLETGATLEKATAAYIAHQQSELDQAKADVEQARKEAEEAKEAANMPGNQDDDSQSGETTVYENAAEKWKDLIDQKVAKGMSRHQAAVRVDLENPGLREQRLNEWKPQPRLERASS